MKLLRLGSISWLTFYRICEKESVRDNTKLCTLAGGRIVVSQCWGHFIEAQIWRQIIKFLNIFKFLGFRWLLEIQVKMINRDSITYGKSRGIKWKWIASRRCLKLVSNHLCSNNRGREVVIFRLSPELLQQKSRRWKRASKVFVKEWAWGSNKQMGENNILLIEKRNI